MSSEFTPARTNRPLNPKGSAPQTADRVIEITEDGVVDHAYGYGEFLRRHAEQLGLAVGV